MHATHHLRHRAHAHHHLHRVGKHLPEVAHGCRFRFGRLAVHRQITVSDHVLGQLRNSTQRSARRRSSLTIVAALDSAIDCRVARPPPPGGKFGARNHVVWGNVRIWRSATPELNTV